MSTKVRTKSANMTTYSEKDQKGITPTGEIQQFSVYYKHFFFGDFKVYYS